MKKIYYKKFIFLYKILRFGAKMDKIIVHFYFKLSKLIENQKNFNNSFLIF